MRGEHAPASISKMTIMKIKHMIAVSLLLLTGIRTANAVEWQMKQGPMMTPWSETLDPENVLGEYPRPQMHLGLAESHTRRSLQPRFHL